ncbi:hypothetical protein STZ1_40032 [Bacillus subtilis]
MYCIGKLVTRYIILRWKELSDGTDLKYGDTSDTAAASF